MADTKVTALTELAATPASSDIVHIVDDPAGSPVSKKITIDNVASYQDARTATFTNKTMSDASNTFPTASTTVTGDVELATAAETTTGTDTGRAVTPDGLAGSDYGIRVVQILVEGGATDLAVGDSLNGNFFRVPAELNGYNLVSVGASVFTAGTTGTTDIQINNHTDSADMLSTKLTIDSAETDSSTAATAAVIDGTADDVVTGDVLTVDVDAVSSTAPKGPVVTLGFQLP